MEVPIIGAPKLLKWLLVANITCPCEAKTPLLLVGFGSVEVCPVCRKGWTLGSIKHDARTNTGNIQFAQVLPIDEGRPS